VHESGSEGVCANPAEWGYSASRHKGRSNKKNQLRQSEAMPTERCSFLLGNLACQFIGGVQGCPNDQHLLGSGSSLKPSLSTADPRTGSGRNGGNSAH
jgi:hypothetical protein